MSRDPYSVLGVSRDISDEELKKVYHDLVKKYHPDRYRDPELKKTASEKTAAINAAYDEIVEMRKNGGSGNPYGQNSYGGSGSRSYGDTYTGGQNYSGEHRELYNQVRVFINNSRFEEAQALLMHIEEYERNAEWYYLCGCVMIHSGRPMDAGRCFDRACAMDPNNSEYASARRQFRNSTAQNASGNWNSDPCCSDGCSDCCKCFICMNCCL